MNDLTLTGTDIVNILRTNDRAIGRALIVLHREQTSDEQQIHASRHLNKRGFTKADAKKGTEHAEFYLKNGYLTQEMIKYWREPVKRTNGYNSFRIAIYWRQLIREAYRKHHQAARLAA